jgi:glycine oxidase
MREPDVLIVGGGLIGLGIGWEVARAGMSVTVVERDAAVGPRSGAYWAAAGMVAPAAETGFSEEAQLALARASLQLYPEWTAGVEAAAGMGVDYRAEGTLIVALDADDAAWLERVARTQEALGLAPALLRGAEAREMEPHLAPAVTRALLSAGDHQVDNRRLWRALREAFARAGGVLMDGVEATRIAHGGGRATGAWVRPAAAPDAREEHLPAARTVVCAGAWTRLLLSAGLPSSLVAPIRPVKGQILRLEMSDLLTLDHVVRTRRVYLAPKSDGRLVVGATSEERGFERRLSAGAVMDLLRDAWETAPGIYDLPLHETWTGLRPAARDNAPVLGRTAMDGLFLATGHYRNGVLLTPITARAMGTLLVEGTAPELIRPFTPGRFHAPRVVG